MKTFMSFNLQLFSSDDFEDDTDVIDDVDDEVSDDNSKDISEEELVIPEEFEGLSPEIAKEFTAKLKKQQSDEEITEDNKEINETTDTVDETVDNEDNGDNENNKQDDIATKDVSNAENEHEQLAKLREENAKLKQMQQEQLAKRENVVPTQFKPVQLNEIPIELARMVRKQAKEIALKSVGLTAEQLNDIEYEDGGEEKKADFETAFDIAKSNIMANINNELAFKHQQEQEFLKLHNENIKEFKKYTEEQKKDTNFNAIQEFAINEFFLKQSVPNQNMIRDAYARLERGVGSPTDRYAIEAYFENAKRAYYDSVNATKKEKQSSVVNKYKQAKKLPRTDKIMGSNTNAEKSDLEIASDMMKNRPWEKIPSKYQKILLGE